MLGSVEEYEGDILAAIHITCGQAFRDWVKLSSASGSSASCFACSPLCLVFSLSPLRYKSMLTNMDAKG